jgi:hypothetical protein
MPARRTTADPWSADFKTLVYSVIVPKGLWHGFEVAVKGKLAELIGGVFPEALYIGGLYVVTGGGDSRVSASPSELFIVIRRERKAA